jgi:hypothetical protein
MGDKFFWMFSALSGHSANWHPEREASLQHHRQADHFAWALEAAKRLDEVFPRSFY